jgi:hypothetical protein
MRAREFLARVVVIVGEVSRDVTVLLLIFFMVTLLGWIVC